MLQRENIRTWVEFMYLQRGEDFCIKCCGGCRESLWNLFNKSEFVPASKTRVENLYPFFSSHELPKLNYR
jgi:uncharacterized protein YuzB (UPF0349 family)